MWFDFAKYGVANSNSNAVITNTNQITKEYVMKLGSGMGFFDGNYLMVYTINGKVFPNDIAFKADNPGLWMFHCHDLHHAAAGMDTMVNYEGVSTPFIIGSGSGNNPE